MGSGDKEAENTRERPRDTQRDTWRSVSTSVRCIAYEVNTTGRVIDRENVARVARRRRE